MATNSEGSKSAAHSSTSPDLESLTCELCSKSYQRRDLLMRHRRRCQGPSKPTNRRKACDACVQAKTRCSYSQPTCSRCAKRRTACLYASKPDHSNRDATSTSNDSAHDSVMDLSDPSEAMHPQGSLAGFGANDTTMATDLPMASEFAFSQANDITALHSPPSMDSVPLPTTPWDLSLSSFGMHMAPPSSTLSMSAYSSPPPASSVDAVRFLSDYPTQLLSENFISPFLHHTLYSDTVPDMTSLPLSSMAICCGSAVDNKGSTRFVQRAMDAERQRLIEAFPTYQHMQQWDALHAMLLYEVLELRESLSPELETWKHKPRVKGLRSPFLLKMIQCYAKSHPAICNPEFNIFSDPSSAPASSIASPWARWRITETARRTIFFANIVNFYIYHNHITGEQLPYYEPLDDELILNMPLPCSETVWTAKDEPGWSISSQTDPSPLASHLASGMSPSGGPLPEVNLKTLFSKFSKEYIQREFVRSVGFNGSDRLRSLIILCACEQFT
ncbi:hypothetical protein GQ44DRAFT_781578 [Phaeosphaeriaceae sp. PMI808]|nr:hypothetical protein GQ44DRAFT_781578 [Phaeosphaeriaceae sp. PMI808]